MKTIAWTIKFYGIFCFNLKAMSGLISQKVEIRINHVESDNQSNTSVGIENMLWLDWKRNH